MSKEVGGRPNTVACAFNVELMYPKIKFRIQSMPELTSADCLA